MNRLSAKKLSPHSVKDRMVEAVTAGVSAAGQKDYLLASIHFATASAMARELSQKGK